MAFLELSGIQKRFGESAAVKDFDLAAERGEFVSFLGPSGCGKTTTLRMIAGFERPTAGSIRIDGAEITNKSPNQRNVGMVFQSYALFPNMTVADNVGFGMKVHKKPKDQVRTRVAELLELIHLPDKADRYPWQLSGGQQQRVALARALAIEPQILLLDEPLSALDAKIRIVLRNEIRTIQRDLGITTVYVTHDQEEALSLSDRIVVMSEGRIEQIGTPFQIYNFPATSFVASFVGTLNVLDAKVASSTGRLSVDGQEFGAAAAIPGSVGAKQPIAIRPEMLSMGDGGGSNVLHGTVVDVTFLGAVVRIKLRTAADGHVLSVDTFNDPNLAVPERGAPATVSFPPAAVLVLDAPPAATTEDLIAES